MVEMIIDDYGRKAIADIATAWRDGAGDAEALQAGTGIPVKQLYADYFSSFGAQAPAAVQAAPIPASNVDKPPQPAGSGNERPGPSPTPVERPGQSTADPTWIVAIVIAGLAIGATLAVVARRRRLPPGPP